MTAPGWTALLHTIRRHRVILKRVLTVVFIIFVSSLLIFAVLRVDWYAVLTALRAMPSTALYWAAGFTVISYGVFSCFDLLGRWYTRHNLAWWRSFLVGFISYAFTMSFGGPVGGVGMRMRLYSKQGLKQGVIMRILAISLSTNWMGYFFIAGCVLASGQVTAPGQWELGNSALRIIGVLCFSIACLYLLASTFSSKRTWQIHGHSIHLPQARLALLQIMMGTASWSLIAAVLYNLFQGNVMYFEVLGILLISAIAGAAAHIPGGIGVIEYVFITMLAPDMARSDVLAALVVYRLFYYIGPLLLAGTTYLIAQAGIKSVLRRSA